MKESIKKVAIEILEDWLTKDDEMLSVWLMKKHKVTPEEYVKAKNLAELYVRKAKQEVRQL